MLIRLVCILLLCVLSPQFAWSAEREVYLLTQPEPPLTYEWFEQKYPIIKEDLGEDFDIVWKLVRISGLRGETDVHSIAYYVKYKRIMYERTDKKVPFLDFLEIYRVDVKTLMEELK